MIRKIQLTSHCMRPKNEVVSDLVQFKFTTSETYKYRIDLYFKNVFLLPLNFAAKNFRIRKPLAYGKKRYYFLKVNDQFVFIPP